jgi:transposase
VNPGTRMGSIAGSLAQEGGVGRAFRDVAVASMSPRRRCTAADTRRVLAEAEACTAPGQVGALWRRAGWSSAPLTTWWRQRAPGVLAALTPQKRGRKAQGLDPLAQRVAPLERDHARLSHQRKQAATILEGPKNVAELLGLAPEGNPPGGRRSWPPRGDERRALAPGRRVRRWACRAPAPLVISKAQRARVSRSNGRHRRSH